MGLMISRIHLNNGLAILVSLHKGDPILELNVNIVMLGEIQRMRKVVVFIRGTPLDQGWKIAVRGVLLRAILNFLN